jgi:hypothetical protein
MQGTATAQMNANVQTSSSPPARDSKTTLLAERAEAIMLAKRLNNTADLIINSPTKHRSYQSHTEYAYARNMSSRTHWTPAACS